VRDLMDKDFDTIFEGFDFRKAGGNSNFRLLKELLIVQEKLEIKVARLNSELDELRELIDKVKGEISLKYQ